MKNILTLFVLITLSPGAFSQSPKPFIETLQDSIPWVDSVFRKLNKREKIAQLLMIRAHTNLGQKYADSVGRIIKQQKLGGVVFFQGGPGRQALLTNKYQSYGRVPLLVALDAEWGVGMRLDSTVSYPYQMTLGAIQDNDLIYEMGRQIAIDFKRLGMHVNFAPVADINNNPKNPVIGYRSFGDNKLNVAEKSAAYMKGMQDNGLLVSIKHFPGHGDTDVDSHYDLPQLPFTRARLDSLELYPFRELVNRAASGVMVAHMNIPALDNTRNLPSTLSQPIVTGLLKNELGFKGLIFSDAMDMKGVVKFFPGGEADVRGIIAGNDVLELSQNSALAIKLIKKAIRQKRINIERIDYSVKKVLAAKYWAGLNHYRPIEAENIAAEMNRTESDQLNQRLADAAVTVLKSDSLLRAFDPARRTAIISIGATELTVFQNELRTTFPEATHFILAKNASASDIANVSREIREYDQVIMSLHDMRRRPAPVLDYSNDIKLLISQISRMNSVVSVFANPYTIAGLPGIEQAKTLIVNYQQSDFLQRSAAGVITGRIGASGRLPVTINTFFRNGDGLEIRR